MSDTKTLGEKQHDAQLAAHEATRNLEFANGEIARQAKRFADAMANPDFQQAMLACWGAFGRAQRDSGMSMGDFAKALFATEVKVTAFDDHATHLRILQEREAMERTKVHADAARRLTLALYPNAEKTQDFEASLREVRVLALASEMRREAASHSHGCECAPCQAIAQGEERAMSGLNSVARGEPKQDVHGQAWLKLHEAMQMLAKVACIVGGTVPFVGDPFRVTARDIADQAEALSLRVEDFKRTFASD